MVLPEAYIVQKFYQYAGKPKYNRLTKTYQGGCPICREGKSWGKKRRLFYVIKDNFFHCHNCGWHSNPTNWIIEVSSLTFEEVLEESKDYDILPKDVNEKEINEYVKRIFSQKLPDDSINLFDDTQLKFYNSNPIVQTAVKYIKDRMLDTACNKPKSLYVSLKDKTHKNRLVIPFWNLNNKIIHYQTRTLLKNDEKFKPKYLSKINSDKSVFNIDKVTEELDKIYIFEGPIDACFAVNGVAVAGITENSSSLYTKLQYDQLNKFPFHERVIVLDSQWQDQASKNKTKILLDAGVKVFIWPKKLGKRYKDFNELVIDNKINKVPSKIIDENTYTGLMGRVVLSRIN
jgi:hypothetical protein|tara:strand:+ start:429 stop:1463 length:1035 start_codon:yes stop_codon:yes gene_type:complete